MKRTKENKGITLIALVITIIVLLILAGVTIATLTGDNGILTQSSNAREQNKIAQAEEEVNLAFQTLKIKERTENVEKDQKDDIVLGELKEAYSKQKPESTVNLSGTKFYVKHRGYNFEVDESTYVAEYKGSFNEKEWDKKACDEDCFIWASNDKNAGEAYHTIIGYTDEIMNQQKLVIPSRCHEIKMESFWNVDKSREFAQTLAEVEIPGTVTTIGYHAFTGFQFKSIEIPNSVTTIGEAAFNYCENLVNIVIPDSVTTIEDIAFTNCYSLTDIVMYDNVSYIGRSVFEGTPWYDNQPDGLIYVGKVAYKYKGEMPENCSIVIKEGTKLLANEIFSWQYNLTNIELPDGITSIGRSAFQECTSLTSINIPDSVTSIGERAFAYCYNLSNITMGNVPYVGAEAFYQTAWINNQTGLIYFGTILYGYNGYMPDNTSIVVKEGTTEIAGRAFEGCTSLTSIEIPDSVTSIGANAFEACSNLSSIRIPNGVTTISNYIFAGCTNLVNVEIPDTVTKIQYNAFSNCTSLASVEIPNTVTIMEWGIFENCTSLSSVNIPEGVTRIEGNTFYNCISLSSVNIPSGVTKIEGNTFYNCTNLTRIEIPDGVTEIQWSAFENCTSLSSIEIPNRVEEIEGSAFRGCTGLTSIEIPDSVTTIGGGAFENCTNLANIEIPDSVTYVSNNAFDGTAWYDNQTDGVVYAGKVAYAYKGTMPENTNIVIQEGAKTIASYLFDDQYNLKSVEIPDSLIGIGDYAFSDCTNLTSVSISRNTKYIGYNAFEGCTNLSSIVIWKNVDEVRSRSFRGWVSSQTLNIEADQVPNGWAWDWNDECEAQIIYAYSD